MGCKQYRGHLSELVQAAFLQRRGDTHVSYIWVRLGETRWSCKAAETRLALFRLDIALWYVSTSRDLK